MNTTEITTAETQQEKTKTNSMMVDLKLWTPDLKL